ncbi:unnamed protein product [Nippostrongylus brasiliensis]|uniref:D-beta-hydroxybutyrate dehydrogenase, mitochondrial n=1 Tax=Nippostrongylus brasiliensis TaxID=27835 RepID=A0A0N4Y4Q6_NIPBR|nr:unnamed protein product [Nippostrongylus brasiliensis]
MLSIPVIQLGQERSSVTPDWCFYNQYRLLDGSTVLQNIQQGGTLTIVLGVFRGPVTVRIMSMDPEGEMGKNSGRTSTLGGFGRELALRCISEGFTVFAGCLTLKGEASLKADCKSSKLHTVSLDVTSDESVKNAKEYVESNLKHGLQLWGIVNNAGVFSCYGPDDWTSVSDYQKAAEVNTFGVIRVTQAFKRLIKKSQGRIVAVSSVNGRLSTPAAGPYVVSKFGTEAYMDCIRQELHYMDVKVSLLEPGIFRTALLDEKAMLDRVESVSPKILFMSTLKFQRDFFRTLYLLKQVLVSSTIAAMWNELFITKSSTQIHHVIDNYMHALTAVYPRHRYYCGWDAILLFIPVSLLPTWLSDYITRVYAPQQVYPAVIEAKNQAMQKKSQ